MASGSVVSITFFKLEGISRQWWAMRQMQYYKKKLTGVPGLTFYKMLGSGGGNGFSVKPDLSTYALLMVWNQTEHACQFFNTHPYYQQIKLHAAYHWTLQLKAIRAKGQWEGVQPFVADDHQDEQCPVAVLTRATIRPSKLFSFWRHVPGVSNQLTTAQPGLLFSKGIGEIPLLQQATFSLWKDRPSMVQYAYQGAQHRQVIAKTRKLQWYKEELFAEFELLSSDGYWPSVSPFYASRLV